MANPRLISFVIPAWNEEAVLGATLDALAAVMRDLAGPSEVMVADDTSTDRTAEIARQHGARVVTVHHRRAVPVRKVPLTFGH